MMYCGYITEINLLFVFHSVLFRCLSFVPAQPPDLWLLLHFILFPSWNTWSDRDCRAHFPEIDRRIRVKKKKKTVELPEARLELEEAWMEIRYRTSEQIGYAIKCPVRMSCKKSFEGSDWMQFPDGLTYNLPECLDGGRLSENNVCKARPVSASCFSDCDRLAGEAAFLLSDWLTESACLARQCGWA